MVWTQTLLGTLLADEESQNQEQRTAAEKDLLKELVNQKGKREQRKQESLHARMYKWEMGTHKSDAKSVANGISKFDWSP